MPKTPEQHYRDFWMRFEVSTTKLRVFRFAFFIVFALDAWLQIAHAPRYGLNDFNVSHVPFLDGILPTPTRYMMVVLYGVQAYLGLRLAFGVGSRALYIALAVVFSAGYFTSQLNSYQHHYLLAIALGILAAFPWPELSGDQDTKPNGPKQRQRNWPVRMLLVSLSIMYFFAVVTKTDGLWTDGSTLKIQLSTGWMRDLCEKLGWSFVAKLTMVVELALACLLHWRRLWPLAIALAVGMHMSFEHSGLKIGLFSYFMVTVYLLLIPEAWLRRVATWSTPLSSRLSGLFKTLESKPKITWPLFGASIAAGIGLLQLIPVDAVNTLVIVIAGCAVLDLALSRRAGSAALGHLAAILGIFLLLSTTNALRDYYRFWGGNERRAGDVSAAIIAYENVVRIDPDYASGHRHLGDLYKRAKRIDDALAEYEAGLAIDPEHFKLLRGAAQVYHLRGMGPEALRVAQKAALLDASDQSVRRIVDHWRKELGSDAPQR